MTLPIFFFLARTEPDKRMRWLMGFLFLATIPAIFFTYSRGDLVGLIAVLGCMVLLSKQKMALIPVVLLALAFGALFTPQAWQDRMSLTQSDKLLDASALSRLNAWTYAWRLACDYPVLGGGFDAFTPRLFARYAPQAQDVHGPHSIYFGVLAEHGFVGLALYLTLVVSCFASLRRLAKTARAMDTPHIAGYAKMLSLSLVGFLTSGTFLGRAYFDFFFTIVACVAILKYVSRVEWAKASEESGPDLDYVEHPIALCGVPDPVVTHLQRPFAI
jgi:probable O-glycosylation ligase (exosortase A-associated)